MKTGAMKTAICILALALALPLPLSAQEQAQTAEPPSFEGYLAEVKARALEEGIAAATIDAAFKGLSPDPRVIGFDRNQPEFKQTYAEYLTARVTPERTSQARALYAKHRALLASVSERYQVEPQYLVAIWGLESSFGRHQGKYSVVRSLATLGHDRRRSRFFTGELLNALRVLDQGHVTLEGFVGGWAGAMGQCQFIPSSFVTYAQDFNGDGRKDIWQEEADVFASIANYLAKRGWQKGAGWGQEVALPDGIDLSALKQEQPNPSCQALRLHSRKLPLAYWRAFGFEPRGRLPDGDYALVLLGEEEGGRETSWLVGGNYRAILAYNCANKYAVSVGVLADKIVE